jgi:predicted glycosyltransferase
MRARPPLLFYCQHSLGMGHLVRSLALAAGLAGRFHVVLLNGGPLPKGVKVPAGIQVIDLPPIGFDSQMQLVSRDHRRSVERAQQLRRKIILRTFGSLQPKVVLLELFPFGRKKFAAELVPLLEEARKASPTRPVVVCSLRDILVSRDQDHDARAAARANQYLDAVLIHSDPKFARLEESFHASTALRVPVVYTGFVCAEHRDPKAKPARKRRFIVSAGGGLVGETLLRTAIEAHALVQQTEEIEMMLIGGPFFPDPSWQALRALALGKKDLILKRFVPDLVAELRRASASISQCGYNTALDVLRSGVPALVVPFGAGKEDEQIHRARRLQQLGAVRVLEERDLNAPRLAEEIRALAQFKPGSVQLDLNGAENSTRILETLVRDQAA